MSENEEEGSGEKVGGKEELVSAKGVEKTEKTVTPKKTGIPAKAKQQLKQQLMMQSPAESGGTSVSSVSQPVEQFTTRSIIVSVVNLLQSNC